LVFEVAGRFSQLPLHFRRTVLPKVIKADELTSVVQSNDTWVPSKELQADFTVLAVVRDCPLLVYTD
jgi:hypothetical protein